MESNTVSFKIKLKNEGEKEIDLSKVKLAYWYEDNGIKDEFINKDWISVGSDKVTASIIKLEENRRSANSKIDIIFDSDVKKLSKGEEVEIGLRLENKNMNNYNQGNNHSFKNGITAYYDENLIFGVEPVVESDEVKKVEINVKAYNKERKEKITSIYPWIKVENTGNVELDLSKLEIRYYYTSDSENDEAEESIIDWATVNKKDIVSSIVPTFEKVEKSEDADRYFSIKFKGNHILGTNTELELQTRFNKKNWGEYNQLNDYSFNKEASDFETTERLVVIYDGDIISGEEPEINEGLPIIEITKETRVANNVMLEWHGQEGLTYTIERGEKYTELVVLKENIESFGYMDSTADILESKYYYMITAYDNTGQKVAKSRKIKFDPYIDTDGDGLIDEDEKNAGTDIKNEDTDGDGLTDGQEIITYKTDPLKKDTDSDGLTDLEEVYITKTNPLEKDTDKNNIIDSEEDLDQDGLKNKREIELETDPLSSDTDLDGLSDRVEIEDSKTDPLNADSDSDGIEDGLEKELKLNPNKKDTDENGILDGDEKFERGIEPSKFDVDDTISLKVQGDFTAKHMDDVIISSAANTSMMLSEETPGYLATPYQVKIPRGSKDVNIIFDISKLSESDKKNATVYKYNKAKNTLEEIKGQKKVKGPQTENIQIPAGGEDLEIPPKDEDIDSDDGFEFNEELILVNKEKWDKYWAENISHPSEKGTLDLSFVIDQSGSMGSNDREKIRVDLVKYFIDSKDPEDRFALVGFSDPSIVYLKMTNDKEQLLKQIGKLGSNNSGGSNITQGIEQGIEEILEAKGSGERERRIMVLTDGQGTINQDIIEKAKTEKIKIFTIGLGDGCNEVGLKKIASDTGGKAYFMKDSGELEELIGNLQDDIGSGDNDGDNIPNDLDIDKNNFNIITGEFNQYSDELMMQAASLAYYPTDLYIGCTVEEFLNRASSNNDVIELSARQDVNKLLDWEIIKSEDTKGGVLNITGFGGVAIKKGNKVIVSFEGSNGLTSGDFIEDWLITDFGGIAMGGKSIQVYEAYKFVNGIVKEMPNAEFYFAGHSLGGWLTQKVGGSLFDGYTNLVNTSSKYYKSNQIPIGWRGKVSNMWEENLKRIKIKKITTFASPGFTVGLYIPGSPVKPTHPAIDKTIANKSVYNYDLQCDPISGYFFDLGHTRTQWAYFIPFEGHILGNHYKRFAEYFR
ncbi:MAG: VWA domain-containing protein [Sarcina sp.]